MLLRRALAAGLVLAALAIWFPRLADAHALVLESSPRADEVLRAAPARIFLRFNSRIEAGLSSIMVTETRGRPIPLPVAAPAAAPNELAAPVPTLPPGRYLVRWKVLSADGHVTVGAFRFSVAPAP
jgi:methionine-rich copper-binding protein CopC